METTQACGLSSLRLLESAAIGRIQKHVWVAQQDRHHQVEADDYDYGYRICNAMPAVAGDRRIQRLRYMVVGGRSKVIIVVNPVGTKYGACAGP